MQWGDRVYCVWKPKTKPGQPIPNGVIFARFPIDTLTGLTDRIAEQMAERFEMEQVSSGGMVVTRKCGDYVTGASYTVKLYTSEKRYDNH